jgi:hypothetical protein
MSDFWNLSDGEDVKETAGTGEFDAGGGNLLPIPGETSVLAAIDEAKWDKTQDGDRFISLRWNVLAPDDYKGRKVFQKLWVLDADPRAKADKVAAKRDKAKKMLGAIDTNCGGKLLAKWRAATGSALLPPRAHPSLRLRRSRRVRLSLSVMSPMPAVATAAAAALWTTKSRSDRDQEIGGGVRAALTLKHEPEQWRRLCLVC